MLEVDHVSKRFDVPPRLLRLLSRVASSQAVQAVSDVSLRVARGEVVGLVGANGAGKTTLLHMIACLLEPTSGSVRVDGFDTVTDPNEVRRRLGLVIADDRGFYWRMTGRENLVLFGVLAGLTREHAKERAEELMQQADLARRDRMVFGYSSGMITRLHVARALIANPPLLLLDEPTRSLDPLVSLEVGRVVRRLADDGHAVLMSSHNLEEVVANCDRVVVMNEGVVVLADTASGLRARQDGVSGLLEALDGAGR
ncbi:MAG: ABC transporter ATP-binding protein [Dehalococcoidia bacterium]|nr:ABC transporter ATP-binding protein [Dehalococcoidia bacterium]